MLSGKPDEGGKMREHVFFVDTRIAVGDFVELKAEDLHHIRQVLRLKTGDRVLVYDEAKKAYECELELNASELYLRAVCARGGQRGKELELHLWQGLPKSTKFEEIVQKAVELGVTSLHPVLMKRCVSRPDEKSQTKKQDRWQKIAEAAAKQANRTFVPEVAPAVPYTTALQKWETCLETGSALLLLAYEGELDCHLKQALEEGLAQLERSGRTLEAIHLIVGPEGGLEWAEVDQAKQCGAMTVHLGPYILRTETAGPAMLAMLQALLQG